MLTGSKLLLPSLDLLLTREGISLQDSLNDISELSCSLVNVVHATLVAFDMGCCIVAVSFGFGGNGELRHLLWRFITLNFLASPSDVQHKRVLVVLGVEGCMVALASASSVEAIEANVKSGRIILHLNACQSLVFLHVLKNFRSWNH